MSNMTLAVNHALSLAVNHGQYFDRYSLANIGTGLDGKRGNAWTEYGWKENLKFSDFYKLYRRGGIAFGGVNKLVGKCWSTLPIVSDKDEGDTPWSIYAKQVLTDRLWRAFAEADKRRLIGRYSALILQINDSKGYNQPVTSKNRRIVKAVPVWASAIKPYSFDNNENSPTYGLPKMWSYTEVSAKGSKTREVKVHPDRIFILGDYSSDAIGFLEPVFNSFVNLEKVSGGGGESFLKNAARQLNINFDKEIDFASLASTYGVSVDELQEKFNEAAREVNRGNDTLLVTQGASVSPLVSSIADPRPNFEVNLNEISAGLDIPARIIIGNQQGERASTEDVKYFNSRCQSRRNTDLAFDIDEFVQHLIKIGIFDDVPDVNVIWDDLTESTDEENMLTAKTMTEINQTSLATGEAVFSRDEVREAAGYENDDVEMLDDGITDIAE